VYQNVLNIMLLYLCLLIYHTDHGRENRHTPLKEVLNQAKVKHVRPIEVLHSRPTTIITEIKHARHTHVTQTTLTHVPQSTHTRARVSDWTDTSMTTTRRMTTTTNPNCRDDETDCAEMGCTKYVVWVLLRCWRYCGFCG
jgi:hypothetical protein